MCIFRETGGGEKRRLHMTTSDSAIAQNKITHAHVDSDIKKQALSKANSESATHALKIKPWHDVILVHYRTIMSCFVFSFSMRILQHVTDLTMLSMYMCVFVNYSIWRISRSFLRNIPQEIANTSGVVLKLKLMNNIENDNGPLICFLGNASVQFLDFLEYIRVENPVFLEHKPVL